MTQNLLFISIPQSILSEHLTATEVANLFKVGKQTVRNWTKKGLIQAYHYGHRVFYKSHELLQSLNSTQLYAIHHPYSIINNIVDKMLIK